MSAPKSVHIKVLGHNEKGRDLVIGDVHGSLSALKTALAEMKVTENDRVFIVGDLVDRGEDSRGVLDFVMRHQNIIPIRGNHEDLFLRFVKTRTELENTADANLTEEKQDEAKIIFGNYMDNGGHWTNDLSVEELERYVNYIETLPYLITVHGNEDADDANPSEPVKKPFILGHASIPFTDEELIERLDNQDFELTPEQILYLTWARLNPEPGNVAISNQYRGKESILAILGHTILAGIRRDMNEVVVDFGTFDSHAFCVLDMHANRAHLILKDPAKPPAYWQTLVDLKNQISYHLAVSKNAPPADLHKVLLESLKDIQNMHADIIPLWPRLQAKMQNIFEEIYLQPEGSPKEKIQQMDAMFEHLQHLIVIIASLSLAMDMHPSLAPVAEVIEDKGKAFLANQIDDSEYFLAIYQAVEKEHGKKHLAAQHSLFSPDPGLSLKKLLDDPELKPYAQMCLLAHPVIQDDATP